jgi:hypothetical protein
MKIVKVNKSSRVGLRGNKGTTDCRTYKSKMMVVLDEGDMGSIFKYRQLDNESSQKFNGTNVLESVESLRIENELTDYLNQKLNNQISYKCDMTDEQIENHYDEMEREYGVGNVNRNGCKERRFDGTELVVYRIKRKDKHNDVIDMKEHLGIDVEEVN